MSSSAVVVMAAQAWLCRSIAAKTGSGVVAATATGKASTGSAAAKVVRFRLVNWDMRSPPMVSGGHAPEVYFSATQIATQLANTGQDEAAQRGYCGVALSLKVRLSSTARHGPARSPRC